METKLETRIRVLKSRAKENDNIIRKLERKLRRVRGEKN